MLLFSDTPLNIFMIINEVNISRNPWKHAIEQFVERKFLGKVPFYVLKKIERILQDPEIMGSDVATDPDTLTREQVQRAAKVASNMTKSSEPISIKPKETDTNNIKLKHSLDKVRAVFSNFTFTFDELVPNPITRQDIYRYNARVRGYRVYFFSHTHIGEQILLKDVPVEQIYQFSVIDIEKQALVFDYFQDAKHGIGAGDDDDDDIEMNEEGAKLSHDQANKLMLEAYRKRNRYVYHVEQRVL